MKVVHFSAYNASGMNKVAESCAASERAAGIDSHILNIHEEGNWDIALDADVHVAHTHWPDWYRGKSFRRQLTKEPKIVTVLHGTPEFVMRDTMGLHRHNPKHGNGDGIMMMLHWLAVSDARVTFWPRHQAIFQTMVDRGTEIHYIPLGVDRSFWKSGHRIHGYEGNPSIWTGENPHIIKDPLDLILMWPWIYPQLDNASLHACYLAENLHRHFSPIINRNQAGYGMHWSAFVFNHDTLRNIFKSIDFFAGLVRYGDFNHLSLQAAASGARTISYRGNPYADHWITEGDQRVMALEMLEILRGDAKPRADKSPVPDVAETAKGMQAIYKGVLKRTYAPGFTLPFAPTKNWHEPVTIDFRTPKVKESAAKSAAASGIETAEGRAAFLKRNTMVVDLRAFLRPEKGTVLPARAKRSKISKPKRARVALATGSVVKFRDGSKAKVDTTGRLRDVTKKVVKKARRK